MQILKNENIQQFGYGYKLLLPFADQRADTESTPVNDPEVDSWKVIIVKPDGTSVEKEDNLAFPDDTIPSIAVPIDPLDLNQRGDYSYQVIRTTDDAEVRGDVETFTVLPSLPTSLNLAPPTSPLENSFPIFDEFGGLTASLLTVNGGVVEYNGVPIAGYVPDGDKGDISVVSGVWVLDNGIDAAKIADGSVSNAEFQRLNGVTSDIQTQLDGKQNSLGFTPENIANKDATGGYAGLTAFKINFFNALGTFKSFFQNANTAVRTYTFQDRNGTIADDTDITDAKARGNHTGTQVAATISDFDSAALAAAPAETATTLGSTLHGATAKTTPVNADELAISDSAASNVLKRVTWANIKATLQTAFDALYQPLNAALTAIAGLSPAANDFLQYKSGAWANRTPSQVKTDLALNNVDNTSDLSKPISTATQTALDGKADLVGGVIPSGQLPGFVDDVLEYANFAALPGTGTTGKIYVTLDTNLTYRWSGSAYVEISASLALGETSATAYRGDRGKTAYDHSQASGNPHGATTADIADSTNKRYVTDAEKTVLGNTSGVNSGPETAASIGNVIEGATAKTTPVDADLFALSDSEDNGDVKKFTWANVKARLQAFFDTKYLSLSLADAKGDIFVATANDAISRLAVGADGKILMTDSGTATGLKWITPEAASGGSAVWGAITGDIVDQTDLQSELSDARDRANHTGTQLASTISNINVVALNSSATYNETATEGVKAVLNDATSANITVNLPTAVGNKAIFTYKKTDSSANTVTVDGSGTETIDGGTTAVLQVQYESITLVSDGTNWVII